jgi:serine/threonine-protein kinase
VVLALFSAAYLESNLRSLRRGRHRTTATLSASLSAGGLAVAAVGAAWILANHIPTLTTTVTSAVLAGIAAAAAATAAWRSGRKRRYRARNATT